MRTFTGPDGTVWGIDVRSPGASNAMLVFRHPNGNASRLDRYAWYINHGSEAQDVTARLNRGSVLDSLAEADVKRLFRRSMPISTVRRSME